MDNDNKAPNHTLNCSPYLYIRAEVGDLPVTPEPQVSLRSPHSGSHSGTGKEQSSHLVLKERKYSEHGNRIHSK